VGCVDEANPAAIDETSVRAAGEGKRAGCSAGSCTPCAAYVAAGLTGDGPSSARRRGCVCPGRRNRRALRAVGNIVRADVGNFVNVDVGNVLCDPFHSAVSPPTRFFPACYAKLPTDRPTYTHENKEWLLQSTCIHGVSPSSTVVSKIQPSTQIINSFC
jgi:hypothetical protein